MKVFFKLCLLIIPLGLLLGLNIYFNTITDSIYFEKNASYFIGSSRVQRGINPELLKQSNKHIYNVGIPRATFFNNVMLAEHLIKESKPKELFIELSPIIYNFSEGQKALGVKPSSAFKHLLRYNSFHLKESIDILEIILFNNLSLRENIKKALIYIKLQLPGKKISIIGYVFDDSNNYTNNDSFLQFKNLETKYNITTSEYFYFISYLTQLAEKDKVKIRFFLPLTFSKQEEREIVSAVYQSLPNGRKVLYSKSFIDKISHSKYLTDKNHLNAKGAEIMTDYFGSLYFN